MSGYAENFWPHQEFKWNFNHRNDCVLQFTEFTEFTYASSDTLLAWVGTGFRHITPTISNTQHYLYSPRSKSCVMSGIYCMDFQDFGLKWGSGQNRGKGDERLTPTNSFLTLGVLTSVPVLVTIDQEMRPWEYPQTDTIHWLTQTGFIICPVLPGAKGQTMLMYGLIQLHWSSSIYCT